MMILKSKNYPYGKYQILRLVGNHFDFKKSIGFWRHPTFILGCYAEWTLRLMFIQIQKWIPEKRVE